MAAIAFFSLYQELLSALFDPSHPPPCFPSDASDRFRAGFSPRPRDWAGIIFHRRRTSHVPTRFFKKLPSVSFQSFQSFDFLVRLYFFTPNIPWFYKQMVGLIHLPSDLTWALLGLSPSYPSLTRMMTLQFLTIFFPAQSGLWTGPPPTFSHPMHCVDNWPPLVSCVVEWAPGNGSFWRRWVIPKHWHSAQLASIYGLQIFYADMNYGVTQGPRPLEADGTPTNVCRTIRAIKAAVRRAGPLVLLHSQYEPLWPGPGGFRGVVR